MLTDIRENFAAHLIGLPYFTLPTQIPVYTEKLKTLENDLNKGIAEFGLSCLVTTAVARDAQNQVAKKLYFKDIVVVVHAMEQPKLNLKSGVSASDLAEAIAWFGVRFAPLGEVNLQLKDILLGEHPSLLIYHVIFTMEGALTSAPIRPAILSQPTNPTQ